MNHETLPAQGPVDVNVRQDFKDAEQAAFEKWLRDRCPSGDVEAVQRQWLESYEYAELLDDQEANLYPADADEPMTIGLDCCPHLKPYGSDCDECDYVDRNYGEQDED